MTGVPATLMSAAARLRARARRVLPPVRRRRFSRAVGRRRWSARRARLLALTSACTAVLLLAGLAPAAAMAAVTVHAPKAPADKLVPVSVVHGHKAKVPVMKSWHRPATSWPAAGSATARLSAAPAVKAAATAAGVNVRAGTRLPAGNAALAAVRSGERRAGTLPVWTGQVPGTANSEAVAKAVVTMASRKAATAAGIQGVIFTVARGDGVGAAGRIQVNLDYAGFADAYGGDYASRLRLVELPACALSTPQVAACRRQTPVGSADDVKTSSLGADITVPGQKSDPLVAAAAGQQASAAALAAAPAAATVLAATSAPSGSAGDFTATSLSEAGAWTAGGSDGSFDYSYPISVPDVPGGLKPSVSLDYDSQSVDGLTRSERPGVLGRGRLGLQPGLHRAGLRLVRDRAARRHELGEVRGPVPVQRRHHDAVAQRAEHDAGAGRHVLARRGGQRREDPVPVRGRELHQRRGLLGDHRAGRDEVLLRAGRAARLGVGRHVHRIVVERAGV